MLRGDTSGTIIDPFFVHAAQSLGMYFCEGLENSSAMVRLQARYIQATLESLADIFKGHDWELRAQAALWVTAVSIILPTDILTFMYIQKSCEAVNTGELQFIPTYGRPPDFSEELHDKLSVLSQIIYFENFLFLTCGGAEPTMTARIEKEFRHQLQVRRAILSSFESRAQHFLIGSLPGIVQHLSVDHAHANYFAGQGHGGHTQSPSD